MTRKTEPGRVPADPTSWSQASQRSVAAGWTTEYKDIFYKCWHCQAEAVFSAADQKYTYEVKKAPIDQQRILCEKCWHESLGIASQLRECQSQWAASKPSLQTDPAFLSRWLALLEAQERYVPSRHDVARKNMLRKLLGRA
jgi:hypothetical protein